MRDPSWQSPASPTGTLVLSGENLDSVAALRWYCSGTIRPFTLMPVHRLPTSVWMAYAKSSAVAPSGKNFTSPRGVKAKASCGEEVDLHRLQELGRVLDLAGGFEELAKLDDLLHIFAREREVPFFVAPVRGDAVLRHFMHVMGPDLNLDLAVAWTDHHGVERLVAVGLRVGDVVLELVREVPVLGVDEARGRVAGAQVIDEDSEREQSWTCSNSKFCASIFR